MDILVPAQVLDDLREAQATKTLNGPFFEPDGGITWDNGDSIVLALYDVAKED
tara:strand:- start:319 stop:477 length:159 start_codon:yes stop_codon:yes gene_type:complete